MNSPEDSKPAPSVSEKDSWTVPVRVKLGLLAGAAPFALFGVAMTANATDHGNEAARFEGIADTLRTFGDPGQADTFDQYAEDSRFSARTYYVVGLGELAAAAGIAAAAFSRDKSTKLPENPQTPAADAPPNPDATYVAPPEHVEHLVVPEEQPIDPDAAYRRPTSMR